jgi:hypothetical protein
MFPYPERELGKLIEADKHVLRSIVIVNVAEPLAIPET